MADESSKPVMITVRVSAEFRDRLKRRVREEAVRREDSDFSLNRLCVEALECHEQHLDLKNALASLAAKGKRQSA